MSVEGPFELFGHRRWATPVAVVLFVIAGALIVVGPFLSAWPALPSVLEVVAGFAIGIGYQFQPFLHRASSRTPSAVLASWLLVASGVVFAAAVMVAAFGWGGGRPGGVGLLLLMVSIVLLLVGLTERYPAGGNLPGLFLFPVGLDGLMLQVLAPHAASHLGIAIALALFVPATIAAVFLTVWAFKIRSVKRVVYVKSTETARGVLWAWFLLILGVLVWNAVGLAIPETEWANPVVWALPLVTVGSVLAAATTGWSSFVEARQWLGSGDAHDNEPGVIDPFKRVG